MPQDNVIRIMCPNLACKRVLGVPEAARGKLIKCRNCRMTVRVPLAKNAPVPEPHDDAATA